MTTFNTAKCDQRRRLAAQRGINAFPARFLSASEVETLANTADRALWAEGTLPTTPDAAVTRINALLPDGAPALTTDDVYLQYYEAANTNFIRKYFMFLGKSTLRNLAKDASVGTAFMNSHRTGGMSSPAELPMGKTFAGRFEQMSDGTMRTLVGVYMRKGIAPNGANGPSTDDLYTMIASGTLTDCSFGIPDGTAMCDLCQNEVGSKDCGHTPSTSRNVSPDQRKAQAARGVPKGMATFTLEDGHLGELSAVFTGAVPGAAVQKVLALHRTHQLSASDWQDAVTAFGPLLSTGALDMDQINELGDRLGDRIARALGRRPQTIAAQEFDAVLDAEDMAYAGGAPLQPPPPDPQIVQLQAEIAAIQQERRLEVAQVKAHAEIDQAVRDRKVYPAQNLSGEGETLLAWLMCQDGTQLTLSDGQQLTPAACFRQFVAAAVPYVVPTTEQISATVLHNLAAVGGGDTPTDPTQPTPVGKAPSQERLTLLKQKAEAGQRRVVKET